MSEFCLECWNKIMEAKDPPRKYIISRDLDICEECGQWKRVIIREHSWYILKDAFQEWLAYRRSRKKGK